MNELVWWFGQNTLAALLMVPCVVLACRLFRDRPAVQHLLWLVILLKLVTPPVVVWPWSVDELQSMAWPKLSVQQGAPLDPLPVATMSQLIEPRSVPFESADFPTVSAPSIEPSSPPADVLAVADNANEKAPPTTPTNWNPIVATTAILAWLIGAIGCAFSQLRRLARYARLVRSGEVAPPHLKSEVASVASLLSMKAPVCVIVKGIISPFLWCAGSARLAWPDSLSSQVDVVRSRGIIAHELAHLRRCDHWITWLELGASILWWWNPLFWYVRRQLRETAEMSCDALAIAAHPESRREYAELLLRLSSQSTNAVPVPVIAMGAGNVASFEKRLKMILSSNVSGSLSWRGAVAIALLAVIALPYWSLAQSTNLEPSPTLAQRSDTAKESRKATEPDHDNESIVVGEKPDTSANKVPSSTHQFIAAKPKHVNFVSSGTAEILNDRSVQLNPTDRWQEYALHFSPADLPPKISVVQLEILPRDSAPSKNSKPTLLTDVKPHLKQQDGQTVQLDFSECTFTGDVNDDLTVHCIDYLSDTGWQVPEFTDSHRVHHLLLHLEKPVEMENVTDFALTIDAGGAGQFSAVSRVRVSFADATSHLPAQDGGPPNDKVRTRGFRNVLVDNEEQPAHTLDDARAKKESNGLQKSTANEKVEPWEISKLYEAAFLRNYLMYHEVLPKPIVVPAVRGKVFDPDGNAASGVRIVSHTPRHSVDLDASLALKPHNSGGVKTSRQDGTFGLPERTEPYRVLLVHESGVANVSHEELLRANGKVTLQKWASLSGTLKLGGQPQAGETIVLQFDTLPWSYSRLAPRLTTTHLTTTDKDGNFSFDRVPPLGGMARSLRGHGTVYQCESGKNTHVEIGAGITVTGKLSIPAHVEKDKLKVYARNHLLPIPYPKDWTDDVTKEERLAWRMKWSATAEGSAIEDQNHLLMNSSVPGAITEDGRFTIYGVPERPMVLAVAIPGKMILLEKSFDCGSRNGEMDLGTLTIADDHDHDHDEVHQINKVADKPQLPKLIVRAIDSKGTPVPNTGVRFYDRNAQRAGQKQEFEMVNKRTDESGVADFGVMPKSFGCLQLSPSNQEFAQCYTLISASMTKCTQAKPPRANVQTEIKDGILTVTFTMTPHVDLEFNIVDDATNEVIFWSEILYQDPATNRWWQFGLVDGSQMQHNFIPISPQITRETIRISALGYETQVFRLPDELDRSQPIRRDIRLKPMPDVELKVLLPDGNPAEKAQLKFDYPNGLECLTVFEWESNLQGIVTTKFPPHADIGSFRLEHPAGTAELPMRELLDEVKQSPGTVIRRNIQLRKLAAPRN